MLDRDTSRHARSRPARCRRLSSSQAMQGKLVKSRKSRHARSRHTRCRHVSMHGAPRKCPSPSLSGIKKTLNRLILKPYQTLDFWSFRCLLSFKSGLGLGLRRDLAVTTQTEAMSKGTNRTLEMKQTNHNKPVLHRSKDLTNASVPPVDLHPLEEHQSSKHLVISMVWLGTSSRLAN